MSINSHPDSHTAIIVPTLQRTDPVRLEKAVVGLLDGTLTVTLVSTSEAHIRATCKNTERSYEVSLTTEGAACSCLDATHRENVVCKHATAVALFCSRKPENVIPPAPTTCLKWSTGHETLCGKTDAPRAIRYPWPAGHPLENTCPACVATWRAGYNQTVARRAQEAQRSEKTARRRQGHFQQLAPGQGTVQTPNLKDKSVAA